MIVYFWIILFIITTFSLPFIARSPHIQHFITTCIGYIQQL